MPMKYICASKCQINAVWLIHTSGYADFNPRTFARCTIIFSFVNLVEYTTLNDNGFWNKVPIKARDESDVTLVTVEQGKDSGREVGQRKKERGGRLVSLYPLDFFSNPHRNSVPFASARCGGKESVSKVSRCTTQPYITARRDKVGSSHGE